MLVADGASRQVATRQLQTTDVSARDTAGTKVTRVGQCRDISQSKDSLQFKTVSPSHGNKTRHGGYAVDYVREEHRYI